MNRKEATRTERRRRKSDTLTGYRKRLAVDESKLDTENFEHRWIKDDEARMYQMTQKDDWDVVQDRNGDLQAAHDGDGTAIAHLSGTRKDGAERLVLCRKPKQYHDEDQAAKQARIDETEKAMRSTANVEKNYVPGSTQMVSVEVTNQSG